jgi:hypothetical protein
MDLEHAWDSLNNVVRRDLATPRMRYLPKSALRAVGLLTAAAAPGAHG